MKKTIVFVDFDSTMFDTPLDTPDNRELLLIHRNYDRSGWWGKPESLDTEVFDIKVNPWMLDKYNAHRESGDYIILMTGRIERVSHLVKDIIDKNGLTFDEYFFKSGGGHTVDFKLDKITEVVEKFKPTQIFFYDDRTEHIPKFRELGDIIFDKHDIDFKLFHVVSSYSGYELKYGSKLR